MKRRNSDRWRAFESRLTRENTIWLVIIRPDTTPHLLPTWFIWLENHLYFVVDTNSEQFQSLRLNQQVAISLPDTERGIVIEGEAHASDRQTTQVLAEYFYNKYEFDFTQDPDIRWRLVEVTPRKILSWGDGFDQKEGVQLL